MHIHFISIGGSVMHQLAIALQQGGHHITGSDDEIFEPSRSVLAQHGLLPAQLGWDAERVHAGLDAVILGMHAREDNPELQQARALQLPVYSFPEYIYEAARQKTRVVVGGSHGKTTTTAMIMHVLQQAGLHFDYMVGARLQGFAQSVQLSPTAPIIVCEGDEYPASALERRPKFHFLYPHIAILTGIAWDHINVFPTMEVYREQFRIFIEKIEPGGTLLYNGLDKELHALVAATTRTDITLQPYSWAPHEVVEGTTYLLHHGQRHALRVFGRHNLENIQAAWHACRLLGVSDEAFAEAISSFGGAARRLEVVAAGAEKVVYRDFAHAPSKVRATTEAVRAQYPGRRLAAVLELHTYSSLNAAFMPQYRQALAEADVACVFYSPHAMEIKRMPPLPPDVVGAGFAHAALTVCTGRSGLEKWIEQQMPDGGNLLLMSSGSFEGMDVATAAAAWVL